MHSKLKELGTDQGDIVKALMSIDMPILHRHHCFMFFCLTPIAAALSEHRTCFHTSTYKKLLVLPNRFLDGNMQMLIPAHMLWVGYSPHNTRLLNDHHRCPSWLAWASPTPPYIWNKTKKEPFMIHLLQTKTKKFVIQERINCAKKEHNCTLPSMLEKLQLVYRAETNFQSLTPKSRHQYPTH